MDCIFCKIVNKEIPAKIIAENDLALAFLDINPISDGHTVVIPKKHVIDLSTADHNIICGVMDLVREVANMIKDSSLEPWGFNYLSNEGKIAGQEIMHFHVHVIPKYGKAEGFQIGIGNKFVGSVDRVFEILGKVKK